MAAPSDAPTTAPTIIGEGLGNIILTVFNEKISFATQLAIQHGPFYNDYEKYKFVHTAYTCVAFTISSFDTNAEYWDDELFDCEDPHNYAKEIKKSKKDRD